ncbi:MAG: beta-hydroxyacyl-ACP dehydratase [Tannerellaceae bacterium]|nr:beta-hydroxyacyl-ACP dehydratase [Tannerellaceae bacterium]
MISEDITKLIPQRDPILMIDKLIEVDDDAALTCFSVRAGNYFIDEDRWLSETGLIEHIAQSASAWAGYKAIDAGAGTPPVGYIGEVKNFRCYRCPEIGDELLTSITIGSKIAGITLITGETRVSGEIIAGTQMKIFISPNP